MREPTIARNYAEALLALARKADDLSGWGRMLSDVAGAVDTDPRLRRFLEAPHRLLHLGRLPLPGKPLQPASE